MEKGGASGTALPYFDKLKDQAFFERQLSA
jgi:hypothetical protein